MALGVVGLKTFIWNNRIKSFVFLLLYPLIITVIYIAVGLSIWAWAASEFDGFSRTAPFDYVLHSILLHYWYVPYLVVFGYLLLNYLYQRNRLNMQSDERSITRANNKALYETLERLCISRGMVMPYFFLREHPSANAYSSGLSNATYSIAVTSTLIEKLTPEEIECVLAHELTHIINGDTQLLYIIGSVSHMFQSLARSVNPFK
jgi:heat shock protein HtpX